MDSRRLLTHALIVAFGGLSFSPAVSFGGDFDDWQRRPKEAFNAPDRTFDEARALLRKEHVDALPDHELYRAAVEGMLAARGRKWDQLLSPAEYAEIKEGLSGEVVGVGIAVRYDPDSGMTTVLEVVPGSSAEKAGIVAGDVVLKIDGRFYKGMQTRDVVYAIRGKEGTDVDLTLLRGDRIFDQRLRRAKLPVATVSHSVLPGNVGLITIEGFHEKTPALVDEALNRLLAQKVGALVVDLRGNMGGLFEKIMETAGCLLPQGSTVVTAVERGGRKEARRTARAPVIGRMPIAVLVDGNTFSGAELLAGALRDTLGATVIGKRTGGKWNVQRIEPLSNGYALKFTVATFESAKGEALDGVGLTPDIEVDQDAGELRRLRHLEDPRERIALDTQLRTALGTVRATRPR